MNKETEIIQEIQRQGRMTRWTIVLSIAGATTGLIVFFIDPWGLLILALAAILIILMAAAGGFLGRSVAFIRDKIDHAGSRTRHGR